MISINLQLSEHKKSIIRNISFLEEDQTWYCNHLLLQEGINTKVHKLLSLSDTYVAWTCYSSKRSSITILPKTFYVPNWLAKETLTFFEVYFHQIYVLAWKYSMCVLVQFRHTTHNKKKVKVCLFWYHENIYTLKRHKIYT